MRRKSRIREILLEDKRNKMKIKDRQWNDEDKETAVCQSRISTKKKDMLEKCGEEEPLAKEEITTTEFEAAINQNHFRIGNIVGFLTAFVILSSLLYYMRRDETDIFADRNEGKVLVMDNPFAQTNAVHLLKPLMDMADKMNTQLICFSGLGGDSIYGRFDNIYVLNLVASNLRGGMQYLRGEHLRGAEEETIVSSQIEVIGQERLLF